MHKVIEVVMHKVIEVVMHILTAIYLCANMV